MPTTDATSRRLPALTSSPSPTRSRASPAAVYLARLGPGSRRGMHQALRVLASLLTDGAVAPEALPWHLVRYEHAAAVRARLTAMYAPRTVNRYLTALRGVLKECWRLGLLDADTYRRTLAGTRDGL